MSRKYNFALILTLSCAFSFHYHVDCMTIKDQTDKLKHNESAHGIVSLENGGSSNEMSQSLASDNKTEEDTRDIQVDPPLASNVTSINEALLTPLGVDPYDPEEIARKKYYSKHMEIFDQIEGVNKHVHRDDLMEGDMKMSLFRNAAGRTWPKTTSGTHRGLVRIPYTISDKYTSDQRNIIRSALNDYAKYTCIRFVPHKNERQRIHIHDSTGCWAYVGRTGNLQQTVSLGVPGCMSKGVALHELMHTLGFQHEQSRSDRDEYVKVIGDNIDGGWNSNYNKVETTRNLVIYDFGSVMHYGKTAFSKKPYLPAMQVHPDRNPRPIFGQRQRLSAYDIEKINYLYNCGANTFPRCGKDFRSQTGSFKSPSYPKAYPKSAHCTWKITADSNRYVQVTFTNIDIADSPLCQQDGIYVHDGENGAQPVLQNICGRKSEVSITSTKRSLFIIFSSDTSANSHKGFSARFEQVSRPGTIQPTLKPPVPTLGSISNFIESYSCNFDSGICNGLTQDDNDELDFKLNRRGTPTANTGPSRDHTTGSGQYLFIESSLPANVGDRAIIRTAWFKRSSQFCISFSYHMYGRFMGGMRLYAYEKRTGSNVGRPTRIWEKFDDQTDQWKDTAQIYRPSNNVQYVQFYIEGFVYFYLSDLAIDDLSVSKGSCSSRVPGSSGPTSTLPTRAPVVGTTTPLVGRARSAFSCDFDAGNVCGMKQSRNDVFDWSLRRGRTPTQGTGPVTDHTSKRGRYTFIESSRRRAGDAAMLESPAMTPSPHCLTVWYSMNGRNIGKLAIYKEEDGVKTSLREISGHKGEIWISMSLDLSPTSNSATYVKALIEATVGGGSSGDIAIDDVSITNRPCRQGTTVSPLTLPIRFTCDFESNFCGLAQAHDDNFDWTRIKGATPSGGTGPSTDNTRKNSLGYYIYMESSRPQQRNDIAKLLTPKLRPGTYCVRFAYHMHGTSVGNIEVLALEAPSTVPVREWRDDVEQGDQWLSGSFGYTSARNAQSVQFVFRGQIGDGFSSDLALDDIIIETGSCPSVTTTRRPSTTRRPTAAPLSTATTPVNPRPTLSTTFNCNFEQSTCGMVQSLTDNFDWRRHSGNTPSVSTGPTGDHTANLNGQGNYLYVEASNPQRPGQRTIISTPYLSATSRKMCVIFYYHMQGRSMGSLNVFVDYSAPSRPLLTRNLYSQNGNQGSQWKLGQTEFDVVSTYSTGSLRIRFEGRIGSTSSSDIGLDDICIADGACGSSNQCRSNGVLVTTTRGPTTLSTTTPSPTPRTTEMPVVPSLPSTFSCNFENNRCGMPQATDDNFDWVRSSGDTPSRGTGPSGDHTRNLNGGGSYLYMEASSPQRSGQSAVLTTKPMSASSRKMCLLFFYHMHGSAVGNLNVFVEYTAPSRPRLSRNIFSRSGNQGNRWTMAQTEMDVDARYRAGSMSIRFEGTVGATSSSDIALDDVCIASGPCGPSSQCSTDGILVTTTALPTTLSTTASTTEPASRYPSTFSCQFENNRCGMPQARDDDFNWVRNKGNTPSRNTGPSNDHTVNLNGGGNYLYMEASLPQRSGYSAVLYTKPLSAVSAKTCILFFYHMYGRAMGSLNVYVDYSAPSRSDSSQNIFSISGDQGNEWRMASIEIDVDSRYRAGSLKIRFIGTVGATSSSDIAIDDLCIASGPCGSTSRCRSNGVLVTTTAAPTTTRRPQPAPGRSVRAPPRSGLPEMSPGMYLCTFENERKATNRPTSTIPGDSTNDLGPYTYSTSMTDDREMCGFIQFVTSDNFDWARIQGSSPSRNTGPTVDKTKATENGHYVYIEASRKTEDDVAFIQTPFMYANDYCIDFYYHMYGIHTGRLEVRAIQSLTNSPNRIRPVINTLAGDKGNQWRHRQIDFTAQDNTEMVGFRMEGYIGNGHRGDISFDDFAVMPGRCDACTNPNHQHTASNGVQRFSTGCIHTGLFYVRCCNSAKPKSVIRRVRNCNANMFSGVRLNWYCQNL